MIPHNQDRCPHNAKTTSGSALIGTATSTTKPTKLTAHSYAGPPPPPNDDRMPRGYDTDRGHFVQDYRWATSSGHVEKMIWLSSSRKPADAVPIPVPGMETGVGRSRSKVPQIPCPAVQSVDANAFSLEPRMRQSPPTRCITTRRSPHFRQTCRARTIRIAQSDDRTNNHMRPTDGAARTTMYCQTSKME